LAKAEKYFVPVVAQLVSKQSHAAHPIIIGINGDQGIALAVNVLKILQYQQNDVAIPRFNKVQGDRYPLEGASFVCMIGRGVEPALKYLEDMPAIADQLGEPVFKQVAQTVWKISRTANGNAIPIFLQSIAAVSRELGDSMILQKYIDIIFEMMDAISGSIHGHHKTIPSPSIADLLEKTPYLIGQLSLAGLKNWVECGVHYYNTHPERQREHFSLQSADSMAVLQKERHVTHYLEAQQADKKLLLILTDGEPADIDVEDERLLIEDAHKAVKKLEQQEIYSYSITLEPHADDSVRDIFGQQHMVIDNIANH